MGKLVAWFFVCFSASVCAQSTITVAPQQCVWRAGDNPARAASGLDESAWQPYSTWQLDANTPRIWVRCHADLSDLRGTVHLALQVSLPAAYELYANGQPIGGAGNLRSGNFSMDTIRSFPNACTGTLTPEPGLSSLFVRVSAQF